MSEKKYDLFGFFNSACSGDFEKVDQMTDEEVKSLSPFVLMMWANGAQQNAGTHIIMTDLYCNDVVFSQAKHPRLLLKLFIAANCDLGNTRFKFKKSVSSEQSSLIKLVANYYQCGYDEARDYCRILSQEDLEEIKNIYGEIK